MSSLLDTLLAQATGLPSVATSNTHTQSTDPQVASLGWPLNRPPDSELAPPTAQQDVFKAFSNAGFPQMTARVCRESFQSSDAFCIWLCYSDLNNEYGNGGWGPTPLSPTPPPYSIQPVSGYGLGIVANRPIKTGETILIERPIAIYPANITSNSMHTNGQWGAIEDMYETVFPVLGETEKSVYMELWNCKPLTGTLGNKFTGIARTNGLHIRFTRSQFLPSYAGVFPSISRCNHCCGPNADTSFDEDTMSMRLFALRPIAAGEQVTIGYVVTFLPAMFRQAELQQKYLFTCECKHCKPTVASTPSRPLKHPYWASSAGGILSSVSPSDQRRCIQIAFRTEHAQKMWVEWISPSSKDTDRAFFDFHEDALVVLAQEGLEHTRIDHIAYLAHGCAALGDADGFKRWGNVLISLSAWTHGKEGVLQMKAWQDWVREPTFSPAWGLRVRSKAKGKQKCLA
ncbi:SET domain-containing protein [Rickenella mellea]|uniref:SET domain-containing protein n=1 Tax=Rickenella mellea TaxID=50990 RepID=A0A4Y7QBG6_9AGAM|nr:SET domain-containing protein [Rickenella mellea]